MIIAKVKDRNRLAIPSNHILIDARTDCVEKKKKLEFLTLICTAYT